MQRHPPPRAPRRAALGLSLIEALVCVAVLGVLASLAAVPFRTALQQHRIAGVRTELVAALQWARWEALRRNAPVALLRRTDCSTPLRSHDDWHCGWVVVAGEKPHATAALPPTDILQTFGVPPGLHLVHPGGGHGLQFAGSGYPVLVAHKFIVGLPADSQAGVAITRHTTTLCMNRTGRVRAIEGTTTC